MEKKMIAAGNRSAGPATFDIENLPKPKEIYSVLQEYVVGQEPAKRTLSVAVYNH